MILQETVKAITTAIQLDEQGNILYFGAKALAKAEQNIYTPDDLARLFLVMLRKQRVKIEPSILSVSGIPDLGGRNFDDAVSAYYMMENGYDLSTLSVKDRLHDSWVIGLASRGVKEELSDKKSVEKTINRLKVTEGRKPEKITLNRKIFADICAGKVILSPSVDIIAQGLSVFGKAEQAEMLTACDEVLLFSLERGSQLRGQPKNGASPSQYAECSCLNEGRLP